MCLIQSENQDVQGAMDARSNRYVILHTLGEIMEQYIHDILYSTSCTEGEIIQNMVFFNLLLASSIMHVANQVCCF